MTDAEWLARLYYLGWMFSVLAAAIAGYREGRSS